MSEIGKLQQAAVLKVEAKLRAAIAKLGGASREIGSTGRCGCRIKMRRR